MEFQRQQLLRERQQFQLEQIKSAEKLSENKAVTDQAPRQSLTKSDQTTTTLHGKVPYKQDVRSPHAANIKYNLTQDQLRTASLRQTAPSSDKYSLNTVNTAQLSAMPASSPQLHARPQGVIAAQLQLQQQQQVGSARNIAQSKTSLLSSNVSQQKLAPPASSIATTSQNISGSNVASISSQRNDGNSTLSIQPNVTGNQMQIKATIGDQTFNSASLSSPLSSGNGSITQPTITKTNTTTMPFGISGNSSDISGKKAVSASIGSETSQILPSILRGEIIRPLAGNSSTSAVLSERNTPITEKPVASTEDSSANKTPLSADVSLKESNENDPLTKTSEMDSKPIVDPINEKNVDAEEKQAVASVGSESGISGKDLPGDVLLKSDDVISEEAMDVDLDTTDKNAKVEQERMDEEVKSSNNDDNEDDNDEDDGNNDVDGSPLDTQEDDNAGAMENEPW